MTTALTEITPEGFIEEILAICDATPAVTNPQDPFSGCVYNALPSDYYADYYDVDGVEDEGYTDYEESIRSGEAMLQGKPAEAFAEHCLVGQWLSTRDIAVPEDRNTDTGAKELLGLLAVDGKSLDAILPEVIPSLAQQVQQLADGGVLWDNEVARQEGSGARHLIPSETHRTWGTVGQLIREHGDVLLRNAGVTA